MKTKKVNSPIYSLKELRKLEDIDNKYKGFGHDVLDEMESTFVKTFEAFVSKDYDSLKKLTTYQYFLVNGHILGMAAYNCLASHRCCYPFSRAKPLGTK